jgi:hypothetical protein
VVGQGLIAKSHLPAIALPSFFLQETVGQNPHNNLLKLTQLYKGYLQEERKLQQAVNP